MFAVDFSNRFPAHQRKPAEDPRSHTTADMRDRLMAAIPGRGLLDTPSWDDGDDDFDYEDCRYYFASWVFRKLDVTNAHDAVPGAIIDAEPMERPAPGTGHGAGST